MDNSSLSHLPSYETARFLRRFTALSLDLFLIHSISVSLLVFWIFPSYFHDSWQNLLKDFQQHAMVPTTDASGFLFMMWSGIKINFLLTWIYFGLSEGFWQGRTLGKAIFSIRSVSSRADMNPPHLWQHVLRSWIKSIALSSPLPLLFLDGLPFFLPQTQRRCLHDLLSQTCVVLYDEENFVTSQDTHS
ncbi:MAG: RDD family protein [Puniceicoccales bacterium]|jgi:uncharacterized RDD family membrane protein YckC|nr:RDD family protein [Puniceicoccales bacterium]